MAIAYYATVAGTYIVTCLSSDTKPSASANAILFETDTGTTYKYSGGSWAAVSGGGGTSWGSITGTLSNQSDLNTQLNTKLPKGVVPEVYNVGDILASSGTGAVGRITAIPSNAVLLSSGLNTTPGYGSVDLTRHIVNRLPALNQMAGATNQVLLSSGTNTTPGYGAVDLTKHIANRLPSTNQQAAPTNRVLLSSGATSNPDYGSVDLIQHTTNILPTYRGGVASSNTSGSTGSVGLQMQMATAFLLTPTGNITLNAYGGISGHSMTLVVTTSGGSSFVITFGLNFTSTGTLSTGTVSGKIFTISFIYDGVKWRENARTVAM